MYGLFFCVWIFAVPGFRVPRRPVQRPPARTPTSSSTRKVTASSTTSFLYRPRLLAGTDCWPIRCYTVKSSFLPVLYTYNVSHPLSMPPLRLESSVVRDLPPSTRRHLSIVYLQFSTRPSIIAIARHHQSASPIDRTFPSRSKQPSRSRSVSSRSSPQLPEKCPRRLTVQTFQTLSVPPAPPP